MGSGIKHNATIIPRPYYISSSLYSLSQPHFVHRSAKNTAALMLSEHKPLQILHFEISKISYFMFLLQNHIQDYICVYEFLLEQGNFDQSAAGWNSLADTESIESVQFYRSRGSTTAECHLTGHIQTSALPWILSGASASDCHSHTHSLFIFTSTPTFSLPVSICCPSSFISQKIPFTFSIYFTDTFSGTFFALSFSAPPSPSLCCPSPSKAIILLPFSLYLHDTEVLSQAGADGKRQAFTKRFRFNIFPLLFITTQELHSRTNSPRVIALSFCKYHGPSLIFILLPPLSLKTPSVDQYGLGLRASRRQSHIIHPCPPQNTACETQRTSSVQH